LSSGGALADRMGMQGQLGLGVGRLRLNIAAFTIPVKA
jgi:hypothetical protein